MNEGWIKLHRKFISWEWYKDLNMKQLFIHFLLLANHEENKWQGQIIKTGQFITGRKSLSNDTGLSEQVIRTCINRLKSTSEITIKSTNQFSLITLIKWEDYQVINRKSTSEITSKITNEQPATNQQLTTNKNEKNEKNDKNKINDLLSTKIFADDTDPFLISNLLLTEILKRKPDFKKPNLQTWAKQIELMIKNDNRDKNNIKRVILWCQQDNFWQNNILSASKLRFQFDALELKMNQIKNNKPKVNYL
ncbi:MAG TPA: hypothetical protein VGB37_03130 [Candidatus Lokiarchaeia archaeon]